MKRMLILLTLLTITFGFAQSFLDSSEFAEMPKQEKTVLLAVLENEDVSSFVNKLENWSASIYLEGLWHIALFEADEWITEIMYDSGSGELKTEDLPKLLPQTQIDAYEKNIVKYVFDDAELKTLFDNPNNFTKELYYHKFENRWSYYLSSGLDDYVVEISPFGEDYFRVDGVSNVNTLDTDEQQEYNRNSAIELAYNADGIDEVFNEVDDWYSYAEQYKGNIWVVEFAARGSNLLTVVVDIAKQTVLESRLP